MNLFDTKRRLSPLVAERLTDSSSLIVVCFCAAWCDTCGEFRGAFERIAAARPDQLFVWLDIEDDSALCGEIDVENFPTLAVYRGGRLLHYGVSLPQEGTVARLVDELAGRTESRLDAPRAVLELPTALRVLAGG
ncbi:MAG TPA: thioredoxin family protein [Casimicrobiaceae bacterium]|nr:thioredoxin family protein [Casimicrobiaceae bacterium]